MGWGRAVLVRDAERAARVPRDVHLGDPRRRRQGHPQARAPEGHAAGARHVRHVHAGALLAQDRRESLPIFHAAGQHVVLTFFSTRLPRPPPPEHEPRDLTPDSPYSSSSPVDTLSCVDLSESPPHYNTIPHYHRL